MDLNAIPLFAMLKGKLAYTAERQRVIAENVANADVPNATPRDLKPFEVVRAMQATSVLAPEPPRAVTTNVAHMQLGEPPAALGDVTLTPTEGVAPDSETRLDGNRIVLEEQMVKLTEARMDYDAVVGFYQQSLGLLKMSLQKPGG